MSRFRKILAVIGTVVASVLLLGGAGATYLLQYANLARSTGLMSLKPPSKRHPKMVVPVSVNGKEYGINFDTGWALSGVATMTETDCIPNAALTKQQQEQLRKRYQGQYSEAYLDAQAGVCNVPILYLGKLRIDDAPFVKQVHPFERETAELTGSIGILGANYVEGGAVLWDMNTRVWLKTRHGQLTQWERDALGFPRNTAPLPIQLDYATNAVLPVHLKSQNKDAIISGAIVDTGSDWTLINESCFKKHFGALPPLSKRWMKSVRGRSSLQEWKADLVIGAQHFPAQRIGITGDNCSGHDMLIGMDVLSKRRILIDYPARQIYLRKITKSESKRLDQNLRQVLARIP